MRTIISAIFLIILIASTTALGVYVINWFIHCALPVWLKLMTVIVISLGVLTVLN